MAEPYTCTNAQFLREGGENRMTVERDDGLFRHLKFRRQGSSLYWFDIVTWPGTLCINGDCGCYVFSRLPDMFEFFRNDRSEINLSYWAEKLVSCERRDVKVYDPDRFTRNVVSYVRGRFAGEAGQTELFKAVREEVLAHADDAHAGPDAAYHFKHRLPGGRHFMFRDFWEYDHTEYMVQFVWCLRAIVWAIEQYDAAKAAAAREVSGV